MLVQFSNPSDITSLAYELLNPVQYELRSCKATTYQLHVHLKAREFIQHLQDVLIGISQYIHVKYFLVKCFPLCHMYLYGNKQKE